MKYNGIIKKSRTLDLAAITAMAGASLSLLPQLRDLLDPKDYGIALVALSLLQAYLRSVTTCPIGQKYDQEE